MREQGGRYVLMDFGVGAEIRDDGGAPGLAGTPAYMAPEVRRDGIATAASDIYSLGVLLFHLVTGCYPGDPVRPSGAAGAGVASRSGGAWARIEDYP